MSLWGSFSFKPQYSSMSSFFYAVLFLSKKKKLVISIFNLIANFFSRKLNSKINFKINYYILYYSIWKYTYIRKKITLAITVN